METKLPHLVVTGFERRDYIGTITPRGHKKKPTRLRNEHSELLKRQLEQAWTDSENAQVVYKASRNGIYLEFKGEQGYDLVTKSLESRRSKYNTKWVRLLNIRSVKEDPLDLTIETIYATVYVPNSEKNKFFNLIEKYATENDTRSGKPKNAPLIESISKICKALEVESFWQDHKDLIPSDKPEWCEVWLSSDQDEVIKRFEKILSQKQINYRPGTIRFPERAVKIVLASRSELEMITNLSDDIAEYRRAKETAGFWLDMDNKEQAEWVENILERLEIIPNPDVYVCILDTGVNNGHPLIEPVLSTDDCQSVYHDWGNHDHDKHGTLMAGVSAYGNLQEILTHNELIQLKHKLESVKIQPPAGTIEPELWGYVVAQGVSIAEIQSPDKKRIVCLAVTADDTRDRGRPSSWSAELDQICSGAEDHKKRLIIVSAGNITAWDTAQSYPDAQVTDSVHDPAQSWNALTIGAFTNLDQINDPLYNGYPPIAPAGGLSPFSTTSRTWEDKWPIKPEILMEGGNTTAGVDGFSLDNGCDDLSVLSTFYKPHEAHFYPFNMTSAATAQAAWFAAQIQTQYPSYWPETIRGLMVHSAEWTEALKKQFLTDEKKESYSRLLRICGYGVPSLEKALYCAGNSLTLVAQSELQPFDKKENNSGYQTRDMHFYGLPWPKEALLSLPDTANIQMRVTLSYFIEPGPGEIGWQDRYRYPSHGLRFNINSPGESQDEFIRRINKAARDEENGHPGTASAADHWIFGKTRDKGSIHSDIWKGTAAELATSNMIAVYPTIGWWRERTHLKKWDKKTRYSLIVSINTPEENVDIYTPVATQIGITVPVRI